MEYMLAVSNVTQFYSLHIQPGWNPHKGLFTFRIFSTHVYIILNVDERQQRANTERRGRDTHAVRHASS